MNFCLMIPASKSTENILYIYIFKIQINAGSAPVDINFKDHIIFDKI